MTNSKGTPDMWAAFNFVADRNQFDFDVALGAAPIGYRDPESTIITLFGREEKATCRVSISDVGSGRSDLLPPRQLEILSPLSENLKEFDCASECVEQLSLALRLFRPRPFRITLWERRRDVRIRANSWPAYDLRGDGLRRFRDFASRLLSFHVDRKLYHHARFLPEDIPDDIRKLSGGSRQAEKEVLARVAHLMIATDLFEQVHRDRHLSAELRLILLVMAAEALVGDDDKGELAYRLSLRISVLNGANDADRRSIFELARRVYDVRSRLMHGSLYRKKSGFVKIPESDLQDFANLVRASLLYFIALSDMGKHEILTVLDSAIFDRSEVHGLRLKANDLWGFEGTGEEHLYSKT